mmetsp:Transcript_20383/g.28580  ORF Transcript_20383/g.28580 Transcript_20383/m.28580 type:complete len:640 (-) Transcript_20383:23-1942(-)
MEGNNNNTPNQKKLKRKIEQDDGPSSKRPKDSMLNQQKAHEILQAAMKLDMLNVQNANYKENRTVIGVVGDTSAGKSTLINSILKTRPLPTASTACTGFNIKIQMVKPNDIPSSYQLSLPSKAFPQTLWNNARDYSTGEEVFNALKEAFQPHMKIPDFKKTATLKVADPYAIQMVMIDTPGPRTGNTDSEIHANIKNLDGSTNPVIVMSVKYSADMCGGLVRTLHTALSSRQIDPLRLVIAITHIDNILKEDRHSAMKILLENVQKMIEDFNSNCKSLDIVAVQCVDPFNPNESWDHHREVERKTIQIIQKEIASELEQDPSRIGMLWGVEQLTDLLIRYYISGMDRSVLIKVKNELDVQIFQLKEEITKKKEKIVPSRQAFGILQKLDKRAPHTIERTAQETKNIIMNTITKTIDNMDVPKSNKPYQQPGFVSSLFGPTEIDLSFEEQEDARMYARKVILGIQPHVAGLVKQVREIYREFIAETTKEEAEQCSRLMKELNTFFSNYFATAEGELIKEVEAWVTRSGHLTKLKAEQSLNFMQLPECKLTSQTKTNPVAAKSARIVAFVLNQLVYNIMAYFIEKIFHNFPETLNEHLAKMTEPWAGATEEEMAALEDKLRPKVEASSAIQTIVDSTKIAQ